MQQIIDFLNRPYPEEKSYVSYIKGLAMISVFIALFLFVFRPFDLNMSANSISYVCIGFGFITFGVSIIYDLIFRYIFKIKTTGEKYTLGKWIAFTMGLILIIGIANFLFISYILGYAIAGLGNMIFSTFLVGLFPLVFVGSYAVRQGEIKYGAIADDINEKTPLATTHSIKVFDINSDDIRYIEAMQNYVRIWYIVDKVLTQKTERATLSTLETTLDTSSLKRCHRSYIINTSSITSVKGNAQGLQLTLKSVSNTIPVSRKYVDTFR